MKLMSLFKKPPLLPRKAAAAYLGLQPQTLAAWAHRGHPALRYIRYGRRTFYEQETLDRFVRDNTRGAAP